MSEPVRKNNLAVWLVASFVFNALLIGLMIGMFLATPKGKAGPQLGVHVPEEMLARSIVAAAPREDRRFMRQTMRRAWQEAGVERDVLAAAGRQVGAAMQADPYDPEAVQVALKNWREADTSLKASLDEALAEVLAKLPVERREALARELAERSMHRRPRDGMRRGGRQRPPREREFEEDPG